MQENIKILPVIRHGSGACYYLPFADKVQRDKIIAALDSAGLQKMWDIIRLPDGTGEAALCVEYVDVPPQPPPPPQPSASAPQQAIENTPAPPGLQPGGNDGSLEYQGAAADTPPIDNNAICSCRRCRQRG